MKKTVVYPGSFDPPTNGHIDLILRASEIFDKVIILLITNIAKKTTFSIDERVKMLNIIIKKKKLGNVIVDTFDGL
ncbi:MAG: adenylyltransferase/cytidyltransferase family protein, partial [Endomicrobia bacterium]|nr:adenylyltransferase/cytidyltransferase family protein [Endomicrobiia bacterium]